jgi:hypothetical protein
MSTDETGKRENLIAAYEQICSSCHDIDDFRAKLLGFLPLISGAGIFFLLNDAFTDSTKRAFAKEFLMPIGFFGFIVTLGLFFYELHGIKKCDYLINVGKQIEDVLGIEGRFTNLPKNVDFFGIPINELFTARIIYPAVLAAWIFLSLVFTLPKVAPYIAVFIFVSSFYIPSRLDLKGKTAAQQSRCTETY